MSRRPTRRAFNSSLRTSISSSSSSSTCCSTTTSCNTTSCYYDYKCCKQKNENVPNTVIIGNSVAAILAAENLLNQGIRQPITVITPGENRLQQRNISDQSFAIQEQGRLAQYTSNEQIHYIDIAGNTIFNVPTRVTNFSVGSGVQGDFIANYFTGVLGPWFQPSLSSNVTSFFQRNTQITDLNNAELSIHNRLVTDLGLASTSKLVVTKPSILNLHYKFTTANDNGITRDSLRQLFLNAYDVVTSASNTQLFSGISNINITRSETDSALFNVSSPLLPQTFENVRLLVRDNQFTTNSIYNNSNIETRTVNYPAYYRAVVSIPKNNLNTGGIEILDSYINPDGTFTHNSYSTELGMLVHAYTTDEDIPTGTIANVDDNQTLLIIDGISTKNRRRLTFSQAENANQIHMNDCPLEEKTLCHFAENVQAIYKAYTGNTVALSDLTDDYFRCYDDGQCSVNSIINAFTPFMNVITNSLMLASYLGGYFLYEQVEPVVN